MAVVRIRTYHDVMVNVVHIADPSNAPQDEQAFYVFGGVVQPSWGPLGAFNSRPKKVGVRFSDADWAVAIDHATADASRAAIPTVYVVHDV